MKPPAPALPRARCALRYAELACGSSTVSVNRLPWASLRSERTREVICPAVLYADEPTTGMLVLRNSYDMYKCIDVLTANAYPVSGARPYDLSGMSIRAQS